MLKRVLRHVAEKGLNDGLFERPRGELLADPSPIVSSVAHLQRCENPPCEATHNNNTPHRSAPAHTPTCRSKKLASTPPELAGAQPAAPAPRLPRPAGQRLGTPPGRPRRAGGAHLAPRRAAAPGAGALCPPSGSRQGRASCRPLVCRPRRRRAPAGRRCKVAAGTVRNLWQPLRAAKATGASTARGHIHLVPGTTVAVVARARRTPQSPPVRYTSRPFRQTDRWKMGIVFMSERF